MSSILLPFPPRRGFNYHYQVAARMLDNDKYKMVSRATAAQDETPHAGGAQLAKDDHELKPINLALLALLTSPFFLVGIPLAHMALARARQHPGQPGVAKTLAIIALILSYASILLLAFLAATERHH